MSPLSDAPRASRRPPQGLRRATAGQRSVDVTGDNTSIIATGDGTVNVQYQAQHATVLPPEALTPPAGIEAPPNLTNLPHHTGMFVGRGR